MTVGKARYGYDVDLREGVAREDAFVHVLLQSRVEHKRDHWCVKSGNLAVEYRQSTQPYGAGDAWNSGIATTDAERWAFEYEPGCWLVVPTERVKALARRAIQENRTSWIGDENRYQNALVPIAWFVAADLHLVGKDAA